MVKPGGELPRFSSWLIKPSLPNPAEGWLSSALTATMRASNLGVDPPPAVRIVDLIIGDAAANQIGVALTLSLGSKRHLVFPVMAWIAMITLWGKHVYRVSPSISGVASL
jgi:hypothetical protein